MSAMSFDQNGNPMFGDLMKTVIAADALERERQLEEGLYLERDTLLDEDFFEQSLDDYDDLVSADFVGKSAFDVGVTRLME
ncbi:MAG: hypothetical protein AAFO01_04135, partial [Pseudomonadota bacterium]